MRVYRRSAILRANLNWREEERFEGRAYIEDFCKYRIISELNELWYIRLLTIFSSCKSTELELIAHLFFSLCRCVQCSTNETTSTSKLQTRSFGDRFAIKPMRFRRSIEYVIYWQFGVTREEKADKCALSTSYASQLLCFEKQLLSTETVLKLFLPYIRIFVEKLTHNFRDTWHVNFDE